MARFQARHPQIAVRLLTSLAVVNLQQEGIDLAIRMGQGDWEGWKAGICLPMNSWWSPPPAIAAVTCRPPRRRSPPAILFFHGVLACLVQPGGAGKADRPLRPAPERLQSGAGGGSSGGRRGAGAALLVAGR
nr:hypothetical protein [Klebsiella pneumoniae subsp. pneumoniae]